MPTSIGSGTPGGRSPGAARDGARVSRRRVLAGSAAAAGTLLSLRSGRAFAQGFPTRPVTLVVPFAPGGNLDITARSVSDEMGKELGQPIVISNRAGAGGVAGAEFAVRANPDGYTLVILAMGSLIVAPRLVAKAPFTTPDFAPVGMIATTPMVLEVNAKGRFTSFADLVAYARANPGKLSIGNSGYGTTNHIGTLELQRDLGVTFNIVPYRGSAPALTDLLGGQIDAVMDQVSSSIGFLKGGTLRALAATTKERAHDLPDVPTLQELGMKNFDIGTTAGMFTTAKVPGAVVERLNAALNAALRKPEVQARLLAIGNEPQPSTPAAFAAFIRGEEDNANALFKEGLLKRE